MEEDEGFFPDTDAHDPQPWSWVTFWSIITAGVSAWFTLVGAMFSDVGDAMTDHVAYTSNRKKFAEESARELEALVQAVERDRAPVG